MPTSFNHNLDVTPAINRSLPAGTCLITALSQELLQKPELLWDTQIVLPTQRLQLYLNRELLKQTGRDALFVSRIGTWDSFVDLHLSEFSPNLMVMGSSQLELIMESAIANSIATSSDARRIHPNLGHAHELLQFYSDLVRSDAYHEGRESLHSKLDGQWHRSPAALDMLKERIDDVFSVLHEFESILNAKGWSSKPRQRCEAIRKFLEQAANAPEATVRRYFGVRRVIVAGLTSLPKSEQKLLNALCEVSGFEVWLDEPPPQLQTAPIISLRDAARLPSKNASMESWAKNVKSITASADVTHEALFALNAVHDLLTAGVPAHEIAVIVPDENAFAPTFAAAKEFFEAEATTTAKPPLTINLPLASSWETSLPGTWLRLARDVALSDDLAAVGQYLVHPITVKKFGPIQVDLNRLQKKFKDFPDSAHPNSAGFRNFLTENFTNEFVQYICNAWSWCLGTDQTPCDTSDHMVEKLLSVVHLANFDESTKTPREREAWNIVSESIAKAKQLDPVLKYSKNDWKKFISDVYRLCAAESLRDTGEPLSGLQILGLTEARYVPFSHAIIVGCVEGSFPHALPVDSLIDNSLRQSIGLPGWSELEALEDTTFHLLTCRIPNVYLSYSLLNGDSPQIRSRWIERLELKMKPTFFDPHLAERWLGCRSDELPLPELQEQVPLEGLIRETSKLVSTASASRLRSLLHCPYRYLLESRGVANIELPDDRRQLKIGQLLHKILEMFFDPTEIEDFEPTLALRHCPTSEEAFVPWSTARLEALADRFVPREIRLSEDFQQMLGKGWQDVAAFWGRLLAGGFSIANVQTELPIGKAKPSQLDVHGRMVHLRGSIDAVHNASQYAILVDYKTSSVPIRKQIASGLEPQLPLYSALFAQGQVDQSINSQIEINNIAAVYFNLREGKPTFAAVGSNIKPLLQSLELLGKSARPDDMEQVINTVKKRWVERLETIDASSRFSADPSDCEYCPYDGVCRKDDPRFHNAIKGQMRAEEK
jgi:hypothetical protein